MIVKNEEETIERVLACAVQFANEIIIVDTGSTDRTKELASKYTDKIYDFEWQSDFSKARNYSFSKASCDFIMWLDADDFMSGESIAKINELKKSKIGYDTIYLPYQTAFNENGDCTFAYLRERIVRNLPVFVWQDPIHEVLSPYGKTTALEIPIEHRKIKKVESERNLKIYRELAKNGTKFNARQQFYFANELYYNNYFEEAIEKYDIFLNMADAFIENCIQTKINLSRIYQRKGDYKKALTSLFSSFEYDLPRSEALCEIGNIYLDLKEYKKAIYYYKLALQEPNLGSFAFVDINCYNYIPNIQIGLCYYFLGDFAQARKYNLRALRANAKSNIAKANQKIYNRLLREEAVNASKQHN